MGRGRGRANGSAKGWHVVDWTPLKEPPGWLAGIVYFLLFLLLLFLGGAGLVLLFKAFWPVFFAHPEKPLSHDDVRNLLITLGVVVAAPFAIWRIFTSHWQARAAQEQANTARESHRTTLFTNAIELLGATREIRKIERSVNSGGDERIDQVALTEPNVEVRIGAAYALERVSKESTADYWPVIQSLCAYVRRNSGTEIALSNDADEEEAPKPAYEKRMALQDIQVVMDVLGRRDVSRRQWERIMRKDAADRDAFCLDLTACDLRGVRLEYAHFEAAIMDETNLSWGRLNQSNFDEAHLARISAFRTALFEASFRNAILSDADFTRANLEGVDFTDAKMDGCNLSLSMIVGADLSRAIGLEQEQLRLAFGDYSTKLPDGISMPDFWPRPEASENEQLNYLERWSLDPSTFLEEHGIEIPSQ